MGNLCCAQSDEATAIVNEVVARPSVEASWEVKTAAQDDDVCDTPPRYDSEFKSERFGSEGLDQNGDSIHLSPTVKRHRASIVNCGFAPHRLADNMPLFDVNLHLEPNRRQNITNYYNLCVCTDLQVTLSCFAIWNKDKKVNGSAKIIPALPIDLKGDTQLLTSDARIFFFDDNLNLDDGSEAGEGICNLRNVLTGDYIDFSVGKNGFNRERVSNHTLVHHSTEYRVVLVQVNILDSMADEEYFTKILSKYSLPDEKALVYMDVNSTIVCVDTVTNKSMSQILLGTMFEFVEVQPAKPFTVTWETRKAFKVEKPMSLKQIVKKIAGDDKDYYNSFYEIERCKRFFTDIVNRPEANVKWCTEKTESRCIRLEEFLKTYEDYLITIDNGVDNMGITMSWYRCYDYLTERSAAITINSFGVDTKKVLAQTVPLEAEVMHVTINHKLWDARDHDKFEAEYGVTCRRKSMVEMSDDTKQQMKLLLDKRTPTEKRK